MIFIISKHGDTATNNTIKWLKSFDLDFQRVNFSDFFNSNIDFLLEITNSGRFMKIYDNDYYDKDFAKSIIWHRKSDSFANIKHIKYFEKDKEILGHIKKEYNALFQSFLAFFTDADWLCEAKKPTFNKIMLLILAQKCGINIPHTIVCNNKSSLLKYKDKKLITKCIGDGLSIRLPDSKDYLLSTCLLTEDTLKELPDYFFPSTVQEYIEKKYELRIFFVGNKYKTMAIFSQQQEITKVDFRIGVVSEKQCRMVPYKLPTSIKKKIMKLAKLSNLNTGSIDMIVGMDNKYYFVEINPYGQYGWVDYNCNYSSDKLIAEYLYRKQ